MASTGNSGLSHGTKGHPQTAIEEATYPNKVSEQSQKSGSPPVYFPSPKHEPGSNWGSQNPIKSAQEGQHLLETGVRHGKQVYNVTSDKKIVKFQPDNSPANGYHSYEVFSPRDIPPAVLKQFLADGKINRAEYNRLRKGKKL